MTPGIQNLTISKKASFQFDFYVLEEYNKMLDPDDVGQTPVDLTGCTIVAKAKKKVTDSTALFSFDATIPTPAKGHCRIALTAANTTTLSAANFPAVWDVLITFPSGKVEKYLYGALVLDATVS